MYGACGGTAAALDAARAVLDEVPAIDVDYLEVRDPMLGPAAARGHGPHADRRPARQHQASGQHRHRHRRAAGTDGTRRVGYRRSHELPWRN